jgi:hypothetical protein
MIDSRTPDHGTIKLPKYVAELHICPGTHFSQTSKPNCWVRFWQRLLLGWRWEDINEDA